MFYAYVMTIFLMLIFRIVAISENQNKINNPGDWRAIETIAENHPYIVAILNHVKEYVCTGTIIDKRTVLTSGGCVNPDPHYVAVGTAVLGNSINNNSIIQVAFAKLHGDYIFEVEESDPNISRMHSNIGLVFTTRPILEFFLDGAMIGNYYATELKEKKLTMIGFGNIRTSDALVVQYQAYHQIACKNPKWYYCICGIEYADISYDEPFGEGGPILYNEEVVGVAVSPTGSLVLKTNINYNVFTVLGPYLTWMGKSKSESVIEFRARLKNAVVKLYNIEILVYYPLVILITLVTC